ncbi:acetyl-CoA synthetase-like protein [Gonapodya prolifera JEL478]|uniref:Acetyl-CoA synthetase-like protein n=1 Tax=Gonapodya prolifera (strain JEL478) TaxID=1344416 RepID=A0A139AP30_GONPJ|nr:acetyl-CoA synthetase-like protein [Gonapodya prolifera JEL478]|eukprot:KXS18509.1 acetyl-CoA synthetase-like protein [Gonapodya prolifera JEL478]
MYLDSKYSLLEDARIIYRSLRCTNFVQERAAQGKANVVDVFLDRVNAHPNRLAIRSEEYREWTYREMLRVCYGLGNFFLGEVGLKPGDTVAMLFDNSPELVFSYYAFFMSQLVAAPLNSAVRGEALLHCLRVSSADSIIFEPAYLEVVRDILPELKKMGIKMIMWENGFPVAPGAELARGPWQIDENGKLISRRQGISDVVDWVISEKYLLEGTKARDAPQRINRIIKETKLSDNAYVMFTSGTTGLPKAAISVHGRLMMFLAETGPLSFRTPLEHDIVLGVLPLSHMTCFISLATGLARGASFVPLRKFSASKLWKQCVDYDITTFYYVGEVARYLLAQPPGPYDRAHKVRRICGNGMRADIFKRFFDRFGMQEICELYAASDGTSGMVNHYTGGQDGIGSVARRGPLVTAILGGPYLIKVNEVTEEPVKGPDGFCVLAKPGEPGEVIGPWIPGLFEYRNNPKATERKILRDVFRKGDAYWRMGDLVQRDKEYWYFFVDRLGDTFRWKSENVSTFECGNFFAQHPAVNEANVYGVEVPNHTGRAGMALVVFHTEFQNLSEEKERSLMEELGRHAVKKMPRFAVPIFVRLAPAVELTASMKHRKVEYQKEGYTKADYWMPPNKDVYVPFTQEARATIDGGKARL